MTLTPFIFLGLFALGLVAAIFAHPKYGLYTYFLAFFMSPKYTWWEDLVPDLRYLLIAGVVTLISMIVHNPKNDGIKWFEFGGVKIFAAFCVLLWPIYMWAVDPEQHFEGCILYLKHFLVAYLVYRIAVDIDTLKKISLTLVVGCCWFGWQVFGKSGRIEGVAGAISDANTLGMHAATGVMCAALMILGFQGRYRWVAFMCMPLILNTVVLSGSRGAFLGLVCGGIAAAMFCPKRFRAAFAVMSILGFVLFAMLAHQQFVDRIAALFYAVEGERSFDNSASSRLEIMAYGLEMAKDYPQGAGHKGTRTLSPGYMPAHLLSQGSRAAHNSVLDALVSYGFVGAFLYVLLYIWCAKRLFDLRKISEAIDDPDIGTLTAMLAAVLMTVFVSGVFSNYVFAEVQFWALGMLVAVLNLPPVRDYSSTRDESRRLANHWSERVT